MRSLTVFERHRSRKNLKLNLMFCMESPIIYIFLDDTLLLHVVAQAVAECAFWVGEKHIKTTPPLKVKYCDRH